LVLWALCRRLSAKQHGTGGDDPGGEAERGAARPLAERAGG
jgi:hypothetical protein